MTSITVKDSFGNTINLLVQPAMEGSDEYVLVVHSNSAQLTSTRAKLGIGASFNQRLGYAHFLYYDRLRFLPPGSVVGQILDIEAVETDAGDYVLVARSDQ